MNTLHLMEALLFKFPEMRPIFKSLGIISNERNIGAVEHPELKNVLKNFSKNSFGIISVASCIQVTFFICKNPKNRKYQLIKVNGWHSEIISLSKSGLTLEINGCLNIKDFLPPAFTRKIIYVTDFDKETKWLILSEFQYSMWTTGDPMQLPIPNSKKCGCKAIILEILNDLLN